VAFVANTDKPTERIVDKIEWRGERGERTAILFLDLEEI
jgi:hypothetical protein